MTPRIYLDYNATAPMAPEVMAEMAPWLAGRAANPSSVHADGRAARAAVEAARLDVAALVERAARVIFTSGGTEADNLAIFGSLGWPPRGHLVISAVEHPAVSEAAQRLAGPQVEVSVVPVDRDGRIDPEQVAAALRPDTSLVSVMAANNEVGTLQPIARVCEMAHAHGVPMHCDAVQAAAWCPLPELLGAVDLVTLSGHKIAGPPGIGALVVRHGANLEPLLFGGGQQHGWRPGTEPTALIVGFGAAARRVAERRETEAVRIEALSTALLQDVVARVPEARVTVAAARLPNTAHLCFRDIEGDTLVARLDLDGLASSSGSACHSGVTRTSPVLDALRVDVRDAMGALRLSLGYDTTAAEIDRAVELIETAVRAARGAAGNGALA